MHLDRLVELHAPQLLDQRDRVGRRVLPLAVELLPGVEVCLAVLGHLVGSSPHTTSTPIDRAVPAMIFAAASTSLAFRSFIFFSAICLSWSWVIVPTLSRWGSAEPFSTDNACLISTAAGGLLVTNVNDRSS